MNWKLILQLAAFGVPMGLGIVFFLPAKVSAILWVIIIVLSAYGTAKLCVRLRFLNGLLAGLCEGLVTTIVHILLFHSYVIRHPGWMALLQELTPRISPRHLFELATPAWGLLLGIVVGLVTMLMGSFIKAAQPANAAA